MSAADFRPASLTVDRRALLRGGAAGLACLAAPGLVRAAAQEPASLDALARRKGLRFGTAVGADHLANPALANLLARECSVLVAENEFKWKALAPKLGVSKLGPAQAIAGFAKAKKMDLRGHTFVWSQDNRVPDWLLGMESELSANGGKRLIELMWQHATLLAESFPTVTSWDSLNEAVQLQDGKLRSSVLTRVLGEKVVDVAFGMMRAKAPKAQHVYNDYMSWDKKPDHRNGVLRMLERALGRGVKIDALGIQSHIGGTLGKPRDELGWRKFLEAVEGMGLDILITELDCADRNIVSADVARRDAEVAAYTKGYLDLTLSFKRVRQVVTWSLSDFDTYLNRKGYPDERRRDDGLPMRGHPYDEAFKAKPLRAAIAAALEAAPAR